MSIKRFVQSIRRMLMKSQQKALLEFRSSLVPMPKEFDRACFNFMIDFELIWGNGNLGGVDHTIDKRVHDAETQAKNFAPFVNLIRELKFPVSWAVLGKLGELDVEINNQAIFKPSWSELISWYELPNQNSLRSDLIDGKNYLKTILSISPMQEILSHGYAHIDYCDEATSLEVAKNDLELSLKILSNIANRPITSFVYPCNKHNHKHLLSENGIRIVRGEGHAWVISKNLIETPLGFWISPGVMSFKELKPFLEDAIVRKCWIHPWMHLIECDLNENDLENFYRPLFVWCLEKQKEGVLDIIYFSDLEKRLA